MGKRLLTIIIAVLVVIVAGAVAMWIVRMPAPSNQPTPTQETALTAQEVQAKIDRIMSDPTIDISNWPTFTNTKYGWSIKYHPDGKWGGSPQEKPDVNNAPSYVIRSSGAEEGGSFGTYIIPDSRDLTLLEAVKKSIPDDRIGRLKEVSIDGKVFLVDWEFLRFFTGTHDYKILFELVGSRGGLYRDHLIKSLSTFQSLIK